MLKNCIRVSVFILLFASSILYADKGDLFKGKQIARKWLILLDQGNYALAWQDTSSRFKDLFPMKDWIKQMSEKRSPLGQVLRRTMLEQRVAKNPHDLPKGFYMILYYHTKFGSKKSLVGELITLKEDENGNWQILSYQII